MPNCTSLRFPETAEFLYIDYQSCNMNQPSPARMPADLPLLSVHVQPMPTCTSLRFLGTAGYLCKELPSCYMNQPSPARMSRGARDTNLL